MSKKPRFIDTKTDRSDVKSLLENIESMYVACQNVLNSYTQTTLMLAITIEANMLQMKLSVMKDRWLEHLPFKEACSVDFYDWGKKMEQMSLSLVGPEEAAEADEMMTEYCPSKHFMLDLFTMLPENTATEEASAYYRELDIGKFINNQEKILKLITNKWPDYKYKFSELIAQKVCNRTGDVLNPLADRSINIQMACCEVLQQLSVVLYELYDMPKGVIKRDQFVRLAERVVNENEYGGRKAQKSARRDVDNLKNTTPEDEWEKRREEEIQASIDFINELKYGRQVFAFLGHSCDINGRLAGLGKYLNSIRRDISVEELSLLIEQLYRIHYLLEDKRQEESAEEDTKPEATEKRSDAQDSHLQKPLELPKFFVHNLRVCAEATEELIRTIRTIGQYLGRNLTKQEKEGPARPYVKWKWNHLLKAFVDLELVVADTTQTDFANFLAQVLPNRKVANILQSIYRNCDKMNDSIVADVKDEFMPVKVIMKSRTGKV